MKTRSCSWRPCTNTVLAPSFLRALQRNQSGYSATPSSILYKSGLNRSSNGSKLGFKWHLNGVKMMLKLTCH